MLQVFSPLQGNIVRVETSACCYIVKCVTFSVVYQARDKNEQGCDNLENDLLNKSAFGIGNGFSFWCYAHVFLKRYTCLFSQCHYACCSNIHTFDMFSFPFFLF